MYRFRQWIVLVALLFAAEPLLHSHPLAAPSSSGATVCAVCASEARIAPVAPSVQAPLAVAYALPRVSAPATVCRALSILPARAPPAA